MACFTRNKEHRPSLPSQKRCVDLGSRSATTSVISPLPVQTVLPPHTYREDTDDIREQQKRMLC